MAGNVCPPRWATPRTPERPTLGDAWGRLASRMGHAFMPWQQLVADVAGELDPATGLPAYRKVVVTVPRQSGKTTLIVPVFTHRCIAWPARRPQRCIYTAQTRLDAREKWGEHVDIIEHVPALRGAFKKNETNGREHLKWRNGSYWGLMASTKKSGHGKTLDLGCIDEAFAQPDWRVEQAMSPAMITRDDAQLWVPSTAGDETSTYLNALVDDGRARVEAGERTGVAYFEWSAEEDADPADPATWWSCMPALGWTITKDTVRAEYDKLRENPSEFRRAYLNLRAGATAGIIPPLQWAAGHDPEHPTSVDAGVRAPCIAVEVEHDRASSAISAVVVQPDGRLHAEVIKEAPGTSWCVDDIVALVKRWHIERVVVDGNGPARSLVPALKYALAPWPDMLMILGTNDSAGACGALLDDIADGRLAHIDQPELNAAAACAGKRVVGDTWVFSRRGSIGRIASLYAVALAAWAARQPGPGGGIF